MVTLWDWRRDAMLGAAIDLPVPYRRSLRGRDIYSRMEMLSTLEGLYRMPDGSTVAVHHDGLIDGEPPMIEFLAEVYVTVLSPDRRTACVDGPVPFANQLRTQVVAARDTLFLLDRTLTAVGDTMKSWIRVYEIDISPCDWLPVG